MLIWFAISVVAGYALSVPQDDRTRQRTQQGNRQRPENQDDRTRNQGARNRNQDTRTQGQGPTGNIARGDDKNKDVKAQPIIDDDAEIPDSLLNPRWKIQRTIPITEDDLEQGSADLQRPENMKQTVEYNDTIDRYIIGNKIGGTYVGAPIMMDYSQYFKWSERQLMQDFWRSKNEEVVKTKGKEKFDFTDMHFDLGPAEKIFGPGGVRIKTQGTAELKFGATLKNIDNPSLPIRNRKTTTMDFDEKINLSVNGKVGDR